MAHAAARRVAAIVRGPTPIYLLHRTLSPPARRRGLLVLLSLVALLAPASVHSTAHLTPAYPASAVIEGVTFDPATYVELAEGSDNWPITWSDDGHQYTSWGDGGGFGGTNIIGRVGLGIARIEGDADAYTGHNVNGGVSPESGNDSLSDLTGAGKSYGILSIGGILYLWAGPGSNTTSYDEARLYKSTDKGLNWTPASWAFTKADDLIMPTILQFGQDYAGARDAYLYSYFIEHQSDGGDPPSLAVQTPGRIHLLRATTADTDADGEPGFFEAKANWEVFSGTAASPAWSSNLADKQPVFEDPNGVGWTVAVSHNAGLGRYLLTTEHDATFQGNLGLFDAPEPWGPWTTVLYTSNWEGYGSAFFWNFAPKWWSADGKDFTLVFTGTLADANDSWNSLRGHFTLVAPTADDQSAATTDDSPVDILLTGGDDGSCELTFAIATGPSNGALSALTPQTCTAGSPNTDSALVTYTPNAGYAGDDSFTFTVTDADGNSAVATVDITVDRDVDFSFSPGALTVATNGIFTVDIVMGASTEQPVDAADVHLDFDPSLLQVVDEAGVTTTSIIPGPLFTGGAWDDVLMNEADNAGGTVYFAGGRGLGGVDATGPVVLATVRFKALAPSGGTPVTFSAVFPRETKAVLSSNVVTGDISNGTVTIVNPPTADGQSADANEDMPTAITLSGADAETCDLTFAIVTAPGNGTLDAVTVQDCTPGSPNADTASVTYTSAQDYNGPDSFTFQVTDGSGSSDEATVIITVIAANDSPVSADNAYLTDEDVALNVAAPGVLDNDLDVDGDTLIVTTITGPPNGTLALNGDGAFVYTPNSHYTGSDLFTYEASDGNGGTVQATVSITVGPVDDPPVAQSNSYAVAEDSALSVTAVSGVLDNDTDVEGAPLTAVLVNGPTAGDLTLDPDGAFQYTPDADFSGTDSFTYTANDSILDSPATTVTITVSPVNDPPSLGGLSQQVLDPGASASVPLSAVDVDGDALTLSASLPSFAQLADNGDGTGALELTPQAADGGTYSFDVTVSDPSGETASQSISVTVKVLATVQVTLQGRSGTSGPDWVMDFEVTLYQPGADPAVASPLYGPFTVTTDQSGVFQVPVMPGTYDVRIKGEHTLRVLTADSDCASGTVALDAGVQEEGDYDGDNTVDTVDYSALLLHFGEAAADLATDFNQDGVVDVVDYSIVLTNFGKTGEPPHG
jgi:VCBS repeat-containing protein